MCHSPSAAADLSEKSSESDIATPSPSPECGSDKTSTPATPTSLSRLTPPAITSSSPSQGESQLRQLIQLPIKDINQQTPLNGRIEQDPAKVQDLATSIAANGLLNPVTVRRSGNGYEVVAGMTRVTACKLLGWTIIPAIVRDLNDLQANTARLVENVQRSNLSPVEEAIQLGELLKAHPDGAEGVSATVGRTLNWVLDRLELLAWPEPLLHHVHSKTIGLGVAKRLARITPPELCLERVEQAAHYGINTHTAAMWLQDANAVVQPDQEPTEGPPATDLRHFATTTTVQCFVCRERVDSQQTLPTHVCTKCYEELQAR